MSTRTGTWVVVLCLLAGCGGRTEASEALSSVAPGFCAKACTVTADCCPVGDASCPSADYPHNYSCENGLCKAPVCVVDDDCQFPMMDGGVVSLVCRVVGTRRSCVRACSVDADCPPLGGLSAGVCTGKANDGTPLCALPPGAKTLGCTDDTGCPAGRHCQSGTCGCEQDSECGPKLDVCTKDRDFAYPPSAAPASGTD